MIQSIAALIAVLGATAMVAWYAIRPRFSLLETVAMAPAVALGGIYLWAEATDLVDGPFSTLSYLGLLALVGLMAFAVPIARRRTSTPLREPTVPTPPTAAAPTTTALLLLFVAMVAGAAIWTASIKGFTVPPNYDAAHHGLFVKQIDRFETTDPDAVLVSGIGEPAITRFYPLALHGALALAYGPLSSSIPDLLFSAVLVFGALVYPLGVFVLVRAAAPGNDLAAGFAALLAVAIPLFPYKPLGWGGVALIVGTGLLPGLAVGLARLVTSRWNIRSLAWVSLALVGVFGTHTSQLPVIVGIAMALSIGQAKRTDWPTQVGRYFVVAGIGFALLLPTIPRFLVGAVDRLVVDDVGTVSLATAMGALLTLSVATPAGSAPVGLVALFGVGIALYRKSLTPLIISATGLVALYGITSISRGPFTQIVAFPWYRQPERIAYHIAIFAAVFAGFALAAMTKPAVRWLRQRVRVLALLPVLAIVGVTALVLLPTVRSGIDMVRANNAYYGPIGTTETAAFEVLRSSVGPGEKVITDMNTDGSMWMYAIAGVEPLFMVPPYTQNASWDDRVYLADLLPQARSDQRLAELLARYNATHIYFDESGFGNPPLLLDMYEISLDPAFQSIFDEGGVHVYKIVPDRLRPSGRSTLWSNNIVQDGTFDDPDFVWWADPTGGTGPWTHAHDDDGPSLELSMTSSTQVLLYQMEPVTWKDDSTRIRIRPTTSDDQYRVRLRLGGEPTAGSLFAGLVFFDGDGAYLGQGMTGTADLGASGSTGPREDTVIAPSGAATFAIAVSAESVIGRVTIDDFTIEKRLR
jgi:hypothetical protein